MTVALTSIKISTDFDSGNIQVLDASDALLATDRFLTPLPARDLLVLSTYYAAQCLMVAGLLPAAPRQGA